MKKTKNIFLIVSVVLLLALCFSFGVSAEEFTEGYYTYTVTDNEATIISVDDAISGDVVIPDTLGGYPVVCIGESAFAECFALTSISLPDSLEIIENFAFAYCFNLSEINFGKNLKTISEGSFLTCLGLTEISLPDSLEIIENFAFYTCYSLNKISISENVKKVGYEAFVNCVALEKIYIYSDDAAIEERALGYDYVIVDTNKISKSGFAEKMRQTYSYWNYDMSDEAVDEFEKKVSELENYFSWEDEAQINTDTTIYGYLDSTAEAYANEYGFKFEEIKENTTVTVTDADTNVTAAYDSSAFNGDAKLVITPNGKNANIIFNGKFGKFISFDISFEIDGKKVQPNSNVTIKIPLPDGYNSNATKVFYVDDNGKKTKLESTYADGYIIFETDHFSEYVLVDESSEITEPSTEPDEPVTEPETPDEPIGDNCDHLCHKSGFMGFIYKIVRFFWKLFKTNAVCSCGMAHY